MPRPNVAPIKEKARSIDAPCQAVQVLHVAASTMCSY